jgi:hypothetical protein
MDSDNEFKVIWLDLQEIFKDIGRFKNNIGVPMLSFISLVLTLP